MGQKGYRVYDLITHEFFTSRDAIFHEQIFPYRGTNFSEASQTVLPLPIADNCPSYASESTTNEPENPDLNEPPHIQSLDPPTSTHVPLDSVAQPLPRSTRSHRPPAHLQDFHCSHAHLHATPVSSSTAQSGKGTRYPLSSFISYKNLSASHKNFASAVSSTIEPTYFSQAVLIPHWREAMDSELKALEQNNTWTITTLPPNKMSIGCKWVYKTKYNSDGSIERYKARLVAKGYTQREGFDYHETFAPVAKLVTVRCLIALASACSWPFYQLHVQNAFLHGDLDEEGVHEGSSRFFPTGGE